MPERGVSHRGLDSTAACPFGRDVGAFVLVALSTSEREDFVGHLDTCPRCEREVASLIPVVRALDTITQR